MARKDKLNQSASVRLTSEQYQYLKQNNLNLRDILEMHMLLYSNKEKTLKTREKILVQEIKNLNKQIDEKEKELKEIRKEIGITPSENESTMPIFCIYDCLIDRLTTKYHRKPEKSEILNHIQTNEGKRFLKLKFTEFGEKYGSTNEKKLIKTIKKMDNIS